MRLHLLLEYVLLVVFIRVINKSCLYGLSLAFILSSWGILPFLFLLYMVYFRGSVSLMIIVYTLQMLFIILLCLGVDFSLALLRVATYLFSDLGWAFFYKIHYNWLVVLLGSYLIVFLILACLLNFNSISSLHIWSGIIYACIILAWYILNLHWGSLGWL